MSIVTSLILRQMRTPLITLILGYSIAILGMVLTPGIDPSGKPWHMSFFDAIYFVSYTATTIGFGEIPYPLTAAQRMWALVTIYMTVTIWFYALGKTISLIQDPTFKDAVKRNNFARNVRKIQEDFILICGFGETGQALAHALTEHDLRVVVVDKDEEKIKALPLIDFHVFVPGIQRNAQNPELLMRAGLKNANCKAVIAVTASDETNLKIALTGKLLNPSVCVVSRSEFADFESNMKSFGTEFIINPYETFANIFAMAMHSPSLHLLYDWLTGVPHTQLTSPVYIDKGHWIVCGFGRFGESLYQQLLKHHIPVTVIDPSETKRLDFMSKPENDGNNFIIGSGFDAHTLQVAGVANAVGLISGSDNDSNNLSIIMTARELNPDLFVIARQNNQANASLFAATNANIIMQPSEIIARKIRTLLTASLMIPFLNKATLQDPEWANIAISRISGIVGENRPNIWSIKITAENASAVCETLRLGRSIRIGNILQDPRIREKKLKCIPLLLNRSNKMLLMPSDDIAIKENDQILMCGTPVAERSMRWTLNDIHALNYIMTYEDVADAYLWRKLQLLFRKPEHRQHPRKGMNTEHDNQQ